ncbi:hypothetical protein CLAFUW4_09533 [Fulvia fulva]|uniref:Uncharacterized protein n=1 Tax=Passalora fulva TaxID=5499 RepID=A0A9Q8UTW0_PASFU|nr:uncharacterized protein CLAFUR5_09629 [Fulvia fulva]KAK4614034.1 hypothetical protein CLAFUR4_09539 [Fulvia fulva]KAK4615025.1 hypothetical protein CLAFUR0_09530 [Fulvia fulva]UJO22240.1 hypothetical protein CLAFUR5_09629 [Fulvia fulva]WPV20229.1 hypothetical protein CLAFUW4_09533 [Fulvia fulva]WPV35711.1 hypothetical protein CLAFUW7_09534 [Fulvia fulva]
MNFVQSTLRWPVQLRPSKDAFGVIISYANTYTNILAVSALDPLNVSDPDGKKWDTVVPTFSEWDLAKDANAKHDELLIQSTKFMVDQNEVLGRVKAKGVDVSDWL